MRRWGGISTPVLLVDLMPQESETINIEYQPDRCQFYMLSPQDRSYSNL